MKPYQITLTAVAFSRWLAVVGTATVIAVSHSTVAAADDNDDSDDHDGGTRATSEMAWPPSTVSWPPFAPVDPDGETPHIATTPIVTPMGTPGSPVPPPVTSPSDAVLETPIVPIPVHPSLPVT